MSAVVSNEQKKGANNICPQAEFPNLVSQSASNPVEQSMQLEMKTQCERCTTPLDPGGDAQVCSYGCTFCFPCATHFQHACPNCGGELVRRPRRVGTFEQSAPAPPVEPISLSSWPLWASSFAAWAAVSLIDATSSYEVYKGTGSPISVGHALGVALSFDLTCAPLTPFIFVLASRFVLKRRNWLRIGLLHLCFAAVFAAIHVVLIAASPYGHWDWSAGKFTSILWDYRTHSLHFDGYVIWRMLYTYFPSDITSTYLPILVMAHAISYYERMKDSAIRSATLEMELAKSHLQSLKTHLQPHFLFNTLHSISSLMFTDVSAADKMMMRLSDLLRMNLESVGSQITTLNRELEFVGGYLEIEKLRFEERLHVVVDVQPETLDAQVPSLMLQPVVENAVRHGISHVLQGGTIWITTRRDGSHLDIRVQDNGRGMIDSFNALPKPGLGLRTTRERLRALYASEQCLDVHNIPGGGVEAHIRIPFRPASTTTVDKVIMSRLVTREEKTV
jgi:two-component system, LytTR family, sensor kinase